MPRGGDPRDPGWALITAWYAFVHLAPSELARTVAALTRVLRRGGVLAFATHVGHEVLHPGELWGVGTDLDFVLHDAETRGRGRGGGRPGRHRVVPAQPAAEGGADRAALPVGPPE